MTVKDVYTMAKQLMFEKTSSTIYDNALVGNLNIILMELFWENNMARVRNGKAYLASPQVIPTTAYSDVELTYEDEYTQKVIPLGLAARLLKDDDLNKYSILNTEYNNARVLSQKVVGRKTIDAVNE